MADSINRLFEHWVASAARAPSAHNVQPARWHLDADNSIHLIEDRRRLLAVADASERDHRLSLGAACEGLALAASADGYRLGAPDFNHLIDTQSFGPTYRSVAAFEITAGADADPLLPFVARRASYRGSFMPVNPEPETRARHHFDDVSRYGIISEPGAVRALADLHDVCTLDFVRDDAYYRELYGWLRFNPHHPDWARDGLSGQALSMDKLEQWFGAALAHPRLFRLWRRLGLGKVFVGEAVKTRSAAFLLVLWEQENVSRFDAGRRFYRTWLELTRLGLAACPMSALVDHPDGVAGLRGSIPFPAGSAPINVLRVGVAPGNLPLPAARLPVGELML